MGLARTDDGGTVNSGSILDNGIATNGRSGSSILDNGIVTNGRSSDGGRWYWSDTNHEVVIDVPIAAKPLIQSDYLLQEGITLAVRTRRIFEGKRTQAEVYLTHPVQQLQVFRIQRLDFIRQHVVVSTLASLEVSKFRLAVGGRFARTTGIRISHFEIGLDDFFDDFIDLLLHLLDLRLC